MKTASRHLTTLGAPPSGIVICTTRDCPGPVNRHSLGCGIAVYRCARCFRSYNPPRAGAPLDQSGKFRRLWQEFITWSDAGA